MGLLLDMLPPATICMRPKQRQLVIKTQCSGQYKTALMLDRSGTHYARGRNCIFVFVRKENKCLNNNMGEIV